MAKMNATPERIFPREDLKRILVDLVDIIADQLDARPQATERLAPVPMPVLPPQAEMVSSAPKMLRLKEVRQRTGLAASTIYKYIQMDAFPRPRKLGWRISRWLSTDIDEWMQGSDNQQTERRGRGALRT